MPRKSPGRGGRWWTLPWLRSGRLERHELSWLVVGLGACVLLFVFVTLAGQVTDGDTQAFDTRILQALRDPADPARPIGPAWLEGSMIDLTAIGGPTVLGLTVVIVAGFLALQTRFRTALVVAITSFSSELMRMQAIPRAVKVAMSS